MVKPPTVPMPLHYPVKQNGVNVSKDILPSSNRFIEPPDYDEVIYLCKHEKSFSLLVNYNLLYLHNLTLYYESHKREFEDMYTRDEVDAQDVSSMGRHVFQQNIVTSGKTTYVDMDENVAISELMLHEQPWTNYSFFSACRDAVCVARNVEYRSIPNLFFFLRDWFDYMLNLPESAVRAVFNDKRIGKDNDHFWKHKFDDVRARSTQIYETLRANLAQGLNNQVPTSTRCFLPWRVFLAGRLGSGRRGWKSCSSIARRRTTRYPLRRTTCTLG